MLALFTGVLAVVGTSEAEAATCPIEHWDCWNPSGHASCTGSDSTVKTRWTPIGTLELRYRTTCRHVWARIVPTGSFTELRTERVTLPTGNTTGLSIYSSGNTRWSKMLNDAGHSSRALLLIGTTPYATGTY
jgi:hypothetical protein